MNWTIKLEADLSMIDKVDFLSYNHKVLMPQTVEHNQSSQQHFANLEDSLQKILKASY